MENAIIFIVGFIISFFIIGWSYDYFNNKFEYNIVPGIVLQFIAIIAALHAYEKGDYYILAAFIAIIISLFTLAMNLFGCYNIGNAFFALIIQTFAGIVILIVIVMVLTQSNNKKRKTKQ